MIIPKKRKKREKKEKKKKKGNKGGKRATVRKIKREKSIVRELCVKRPWRERESVNKDGSRGEDDKGEGKDRE